MDYKSSIDYQKIVVRHWAEVVLDAESVASLRDSMEGELDASAMSVMS